MRIPSKLRRTDGMPWVIDDNKPAEVTEAGTDEGLVIAVKGAIAASAEPISQNAIAEAVKKRRASIGPAVELLVDRGEVDVVQAGNRRKFRIASSLEEEGAA